MSLCAVQGNCLQQMERLIRIETEERMQERKCRKGIAGNSINAALNAVFSSH